MFDKKDSGSLSNGSKSSWAKTLPYCMVTEIRLLFYLNLNKGGRVDVLVKEMELSERGLLGAFQEF